MKRIRYKAMSHLKFYLWMIHLRILIHSKNLLFKRLVKSYSSSLASYTWITVDIYINKYLFNNWLDHTLFNFNYSSKKELHQLTQRERR
jgi:hypothetical protein